MAANPIVLLGAGASVDAGVPQGADMTRRILERVNTKQPHSTVTRVLNFVCGQIVAYQAADGTDPYSGVEIETLAAALEALSERQATPVAPFVSQWHEAISRFEREKTARSWMRRKVRAKLRGNDSGPIDPYDPINDLWEHAFPGRIGVDIFAKAHEVLVDQMVIQLGVEAASVRYIEPLVALGTRSGGLTIASLNYDLAIEEACRNLDLAAYTGLDAWVANREWDWPLEGVRLLKLHGSVGWHWKRPGLVQENVRVIIVDTELEDAGLFRPALLFGQGTKLRAEGPFLSLLAEFDRLLAQHDRLVVVGYSFRDVHVNHVIASWLKADDTRRIEVIDPSFPEPRRRHRDALGGFDHFRDELRYSLGSTRKSSATRLRVTREKAAAALATYDF